MGGYLTMNLLPIANGITSNVKNTMPQLDEVKLFYKETVVYLEKLSKSKFESEEFVKNIIKDYLNNTFYSRFMINTRGNADLAIYKGLNKDSKVSILIETKSLTNKREMPTTKNLNTKALQELILYFLRELLVEKNDEIKNLIITNGYEWFIFDSSEFYNHFGKNKDLVEAFYKFEDKMLISSNTSYFYEEKASPAIDKAIANGLSFVHFSFNDFVFRNDAKQLRIKKNRVNQLYRFFSAENLMGLPVQGDSNKLNKEFYNELLYIMGLEEVKVKNTKVIQRSSSPQPGSLLENVLQQLSTKDDYELKSSENRFDIAIQLMTTWVNRILFLKLLESQLISYLDKNDIAFMNEDTIPEFNELNFLFFSIMAKKTQDRDTLYSSKYKDIPYLNSALFEETDLEKKYMNITSVSTQPLTVYGKTAVKKKGKRKSGQLPLLTYIFKFLNSYDFTTTSGSHHTTNYLINASVLGLVFEKINGYKEGSFYTPGKITMYMSRKSIRGSIVNRINSDMGWNCKDINDLYNCLTNNDLRDRVNEIINDMKICDPAVGSGHFLVSALNDLISIKSELNLLKDEDGKYLTSYNISITNDELMVKDINGEQFKYNYKDRESQRVQKLLFLEKKQLIENCLFGVDINPNSVAICQLRLWIELLKSSYYEENYRQNTKELVTLPNIDINIKVGNSLISRYNLSTNLSKENNEYFKDYLLNVERYKTTSNKREKKNIENTINQIKMTLGQNFLVLMSNSLRKKYQDLKSLEDNIELIEPSPAEKKYKADQVKKLKKEIIKLEKKKEKEENNPIYKNSFEWRLEFPEVLSDDWSFKGFDLIIGNPPYIFARGKSFSQIEKKYYTTRYKTAEYQVNTYHLFIELGYSLLREGGTLGYIVPNSLLTIQTNMGLRKYLLSNTRNLFIINSKDKIFEDASIDNCIVFFEKNNPDNVTFLELNDNDFADVGKVPSTYFGNEPIFSLSLVGNQMNMPILNKIKSQSRIDKVANVKSGIKAYEVGKGNPKQTEEMMENRIYHSYNPTDSAYVKYLQGENIKRYKLEWSGEWIKYGDNLAAKRKSELFTEPRIIVRQIPNSPPYSINATYTSERYINDLNSIIIYDFGADPYFVLGVLNSKIETFWFINIFDKMQRGIFPQFKISELKMFPVPKEDGIISEKIASLSARQVESYSIDRDKQIDTLVNKLYGITEEEEVTINEFLNKIN